jgi:hypothetical protein
LDYNPAGTIHASNSKSETGKSTIGRFEPSTIHEFFTNARMSGHKFVYSWHIRGWFEKSPISAVSRILDLELLHSKSNT